jgi:hypothetical protein
MLGRFLLGACREPHLTYSIRVCGGNHATGKGLLYDRPCDYLLGANRMTKTIAVLFLSVSGLMATSAYAGIFDDDHRDHRDHHWSAPEIDPSSAITALTLLLGGVTVLRSRIGKK